MPGLRRELMELKLPIKPGKKLVKHMPRRFAPEVMFKIKEEIKRLLKIKSIRTGRYVKSITNIFSVIKKNETLRVFTNFRDMNVATLKDEYPMHGAKMLVDSATGFKYLSILYGYSGYK